MIVSQGLASGIAERNIRYIPICQNKLLCADKGIWRALIADEFKSLSLPVASEHYLGQFDQRDYWVLEIADSSEPPGDAWQWLGLRSQLGVLGEAEFLLAGRALQVLQWHHDHQYCGRCGLPTVPDAMERAKYCESCAVHFYPRLSPCVIVLIIRGQECLLARHRRSSQPVYTALAGFIEVGETPEDTVIREVNEEVGLTLAGLRYFASQPWPFPGQLMLGFFADYAGGDIKIDKHEITEASWYRYDNLPPVPPLATLSGRLIARFVEQCQQHVVEK